MPDPKEEILKEAFERGNHAAIKEVLDQRPNVNNVSISRDEPLFHAVVRTQNKALITLFLEHAKKVPIEELNIDITNIYGNTAIMDPTIKGIESIVALLLEYRAIPDVATNTGFTALHAAAALDSPRVAELLLKNGANPNVVRSKDPINNYAHVTPLHQAALHRNLPMVTLLAAYNADITAKMTDLDDNSQFTARQIYISDPAHRNKGADFDQAIKEGVKQKEIIEVEKRAQSHPKNKRNRNNEVEESATSAKRTATVNDTHTSNHSVGSPCSRLITQTVSVLPNIRDKMR